MVETQESFDIWEPYMKSGNLSERRFNKVEEFPVKLLDKERLQYEVQEGENVVFIDAKTGHLIGMMIQKLLDDPVLIENLNGAAIDHVNKGVLSIRVSVLFPRIPSALMP